MTLFLMPIKIFPSIKLCYDLLTLIPNGLKSAMTLLINVMLVERVNWTPHPLPLWIDELEI
jgi:hypothetical protein